MHKSNSLYLNKKSLFTVFALFFIAIFAVGGCNDGNNGDGGVDSPGPDTSACEELTTPCTSITEVKTAEGNYVECVLDDSTCVVNLFNVTNQMTDQGFNVLNIFWLEAWGGIGGGAGQTGNISEGGYAQTTTNLTSFEQGSSGRKLYYFLGGAGPNSNAHCGSGGGASTIVTTEDLTLNPASDPTPSLVMLVAGGGGGAAGAKIDGCSSGTGSAGAAGGVAIATADSQIIGAGSGCNTSDNTCVFDDCGDCSGGFNQGQGGGTTGALGGVGQPCLCLDSLPTNGNSSVGGLGGRGGNGKDCTSGTGGGKFINAALTFSNGEGGSGGEGDDNKNCTTGGGGGGGGYGGGGGGSRGNDETKGVGGGGGGSFAVISTDSSKLSPSSIQTNPCGSNGCVRINFPEAQSAE